MSPQIGDKVDFSVFEYKIMDLVAIGIKLGAVHGFNKNLALSRVKIFG